MDSALSIANTSLNALTSALAVTAENIANTQTPGYVDETAQLTPLGGDASGIGTGVGVATISQAANALLAANNTQAQGALANLNATQQVLTGIQDIFPLGQSSASSTSSTGSSTSNTSIAGQLASFWSSWDAIARDPSATAARAQVVTVAQGLVTSLNESSTQLSQLAQNTQSQLGVQVTQSNTLLAQVASLNSQIVATRGGGGNANQLEDQLTQVVGQLSNLVGASATMQHDGTAMISVGGVALVQENQAATLSTATNAGVVSVISSPGGVTVPVSSGTVAGLLSGLNQYLPQYHAALDSVANSLSSTVNTQLAAGYSATGVSGSANPLFSGSGAAHIAVNAAVVANPDLIAAASTNSAAGANDGSNAQAMAELSSSASGPDVNYQSLVQGIGTVTSNVITQTQAQSAVANQAQSALSAATGVNLDSELTNMMTFQQNYEASAKLLSTISATMQSLLTAV